MNVKMMLVIVFSFTLGAIVQYRCDSRLVARVLKSDDWNITRNVEQANALLDMYEQYLTAVQQQDAKDHIKRDASGRETQ